MINNYTGIFKENVYSDFISIFQKKDSKDIFQNILMEIIIEDKNNKNDSEFFLKIFQLFSYQQSDKFAIYIRFGDIYNNVSHSTKFNLKFLLKIYCEVKNLSTKNLFYKQSDFKQLNEFVAEMYYENSEFFKATSKHRKTIEGSILINTSILTIQPRQISYLFYDSHKKIIICNVQNLVNSKIMSKKFKGKELKNAIPYFNIAIENNLMHKIAEPFLKIIKKNLILGSYYQIK